MILAMWYHTVLAFFFTVLAILVMIVILLQRGKGVGLAGAIFTTVQAQALAMGKTGATFEGIRAGFLVAVGVAALGVLASAVRGTNTNK